MVHKKKSQIYEEGDTCKLFKGASETWGLEQVKWIGGFQVKQSVSFLRESGVNTHLNKSQLFLRRLPKTIEKSNLSFF